MENKDLLTAKKAVRGYGITVLDMTETAFMTALLCVVSPHTIFLPISPVGITLGTFCVYLTGAVLGPFLGTLSVLLYLFLGFAGLPVFSGYTAGAAKLFGPTGGYMIGYLFCAFIIGLFMRGYKKGIRGTILLILGGIAGTFLLYAFGTVWFLTVYTKGISFGDAIKKCVLPFLPFDTVKLLLTAVLVPPVRQAVWRLRADRGR